MKGFRDELENYEPLRGCSCGTYTCGIHKILFDHQQRGYVMQFLMGLNDLFSKVRAQILLLDPLPPLNKVFSLVIQEERQREITINHSSNTKTTTFLTTALKNGGKQHFPRKDKPICTHLKIF